MRGTIRSQHPDWSAARIEREIGRRITGIDVTKLPTWRGEPDEATGRDAADAPKPARESGE